MQLAQQTARARIVRARHPSTVGSAGESLLRISLSWSHTPAMLDQLLGGAGRLLPHHARYNFSAQLPEARIH